MAESQPTLFDLEEWRPIPGYEGLYEVSAHGQVRSLDRIIVGSDGVPQRRKGKILAQITHNKYGHQIVGLRSGHQRKKKIFVHRLVLTAFVGAREEGEVCRHLDGDSRNNHVSNLAWGTHEENMADMKRHGTNHWKNKKECPRGHALESPNLVAWKIKRGHRSCLACSRTATHVWRHPYLEGDFQAISDSYYEDVLRGVDRRKVRQASAASASPSAA